MSHIYKDFNIKTFESETIVYHDGIFCPDLSTLQSCTINKNYDKPIHIIYVGDLPEHTVLPINLEKDNQQIFLTVHVKNKNTAFFNILIENTGNNSKIISDIIFENYADLTFDCLCHHAYKNTSISVKSKLLAYENSISKITATAKIDVNCANCDSNISMLSFSEENAKITFLPSQKIQSVPKNASHSASVYTPSRQQIEFLHESGIKNLEKVIKETFINL